MHYCKSKIRFFVFIVFFGSCSLSYGQQKTFYLDSLPQPVIFYGFDLSHLRLVDSTHSVNDLTGFIPMIESYLNEKTLSDVLQRYLRSNYLRVDLRTTDKLNQAINDSTILVKTTPYVANDSNLVYLKSYQLEDSTGTGLIIVFDYFDRYKESVAAYAMLFDISSRKILSLNTIIDRQSHNFKKLPAWRCSYFTAEKLLEDLNLKFTPPGVEGTIYAGLIFGAGSSRILGNEGGSVKLHVHAGFLSEFKIDDYWRFQPSLVISTKGYSDVPVYGDEDVELLYLDLNLNFKFTPTRYFYMGAGIYGGYLTYSNFHYLAYGTDYFDDINLEKYTNNFDFGLNGLLGWRFANGVGFELSYQYGLREIFNDRSKENVERNYGPPRPLPESIKGKNAVTAVSFYYLFNLK